MRFIQAGLLLIVSAAALTTVSCGQMRAEAPGSAAEVEVLDTDSSAPRDNKPVVLVPEASGTVLYESPAADIDASHTGEGYVMVNYRGSVDKVKLQIMCPDDVTYTYNLHGGYETFPLTAGDGTYTLYVFENVTDNQYATAMSQTLEVQITNQFGPYLYPNQYVNFDASMKTITLAGELSEGMTTDLEVIAKVYNYVVENITYDYDKATDVESGALSGYLPVVDEVLDSGTGICFDYAAVMASMLRSQQIPTRLEVGYAGSTYHAWVSTYVTDAGWINGIIKFDGKSWELMDPTFAASNSEKSVRNFIGDGSNYMTKYIY